LNNFYHDVTVASSQRRAADACLTFCTLDKKGEMLAKVIFIAGFTLIVSFARVLDTATPALAGARTDGSVGPVKTFAGNGGNFPDRRGGRQDGRRQEPVS
jgi:hypothetical protein